MRSLMMFRLFAAALMAAIGLQIVPAATPVSHAVHGSAFSTGTLEVAVLSLRRDAGHNAPAEPEPTFGPPPGAMGAPAAQYAFHTIDIPPPAAIPRALVPDPSDMRSAPSLPRAPPSV